MISCSANCRAVCGVEPGLVWGTSKCDFLLKKEAVRIRTLVSPAGLYYKQIEKLHNCRGPSRTCVASILVATVVATLNRLGRIRARKRRVRTLEVSNFESRIDAIRGGVVPSRSRHARVVVNASSFVHARPVVVAAANDGLQLGSAPYGAVFSSPAPGRLRGLWRLIKGNTILGFPPGAKGATKQ